MKKYTVKMTSEALYDILEIVSYIENDCDNIVGARKYVGKFRKAVDSLKYMPGSRA